MGGRREVSIISHRPVTRSDLKQERSVFRGSVSRFLQLVVAFLIFSTPVQNFHIVLPTKYVFSVFYLSFLLSIALFLVDVSWPVAYFPFISVFPFLCIPNLWT